MSKYFVSFDGMTWPRTSIDDENENEVEWELRYGKPEKIRFVAASHVAAYRALIEMPQKRRNKRIEQIKKAMRE